MTFAEVLALLDAIGIEVEVVTTEEQRAFNLAEDARIAAAMPELPTAPKCAAENCGQPVFGRPSETNKHCPIHR